MAEGSGSAPPPGPWDPTERLAPTSPVTPATARASAVTVRHALPPEAAAAASDPANRFGKYLRSIRLGAGGMGEVWKAWDETLGRWVALKFLKFELEEDLERFQREARITAGLNHPNICSVFEIGDHEGRPFIAMQLVNGRLLKDVPREDPRRLVSLVRDAALAVHHAHERGVVHRDLKPENIMVEEPGGRVYVMDFGLAKRTAAEGLSMSGTVMGTPAYMPPEQARGRIREIDARSDVYSLGATLYQLLGNRTPFQHPEVYEILRRIVEEEPARLRKVNPQVSIDLETIVMKCLEKDPAGRYDSARELAEDLDRWLAGEPVRARRLTLVGWLGRKAAKHRRLLIAAGLLLIAGMGTIFVPQVVRAREARILEEEGLARGEQAIADLETLLSGRTWQMDEALSQAASARKALDGVTLTVDNRRRAILGIVRVLVMTNEYALADEYCTSAIRMRDDVPAAAFVERARVRFHLHREDRYGRYITSSDPSWPAMREKIRADLDRAAALPGVDRALVETYAKALDAAPADAAPRFQAEAERRKDWRLWEEAGRAWFYARRWADSIAAFDRALEIRPRSPTLVVQRSSPQNLFGRSSEAIVGLGEVIEADPGNVNAYINRAGAYLIEGRRAEAIRDIRAGLAREPKQAMALAVLARALQLSGDVAAAEETANESIRSDPGLAIARITRGSIRQTRGDFDGADLDFRDAITWEPRNAWGFTSRGDLHRVKAETLAAEGRRDLVALEWELALENYTMALTVEPDNARALLNRGDLFLEKGEPDRALQDFNADLKVQPGEPEALLGRGRAYFLKAERRSARRELQELLKRPPGDSCRLQAEALLKEMEGD